jgi:hypothetical protein
LITFCVIRNGLTGLYITNRLEGDPPKKKNPARPVTRGDYQAAHLAADVPDPLFMRAAGI